jgi:uncharacterized 2Fe-2S/4Fe-4S cluster protein (DUF4445 family)
MPRLTVTTDLNTLRIPFHSGLSVRQILEGAGIGIRSGCRGNGACGLCKVKIEEGTINDLEQNESVILTSEDRKQNIRLACQVMPKYDLSIRIFKEASKNRWRDLSPEYLPCSSSSLDYLAEKSSVPKGYGLAIDLGTTHICLTLWDLNQGKRLFGRIGLNPQSQYGSDVVNRLMAAAESPDRAREIARLPLLAIREALLDLCSENSLSPEKIMHIAIVGNTPMMLLLTETDPRPLLQPSNWTKIIDCQPVNSLGWADVLGIHPEASVEVVSPFAGFVGSDLLAGVLATRMLENPGNLIIDFGTNSEMALWDGTTLWVTSAAGGPAFEGSGIKCGMPAETGAIYQVKEESGSLESGFQVIGGAQPRGFCGSGLVDLIAYLRRAGNLTKIGKFANLASAEEFRISKRNPNLRLSSGDVDLFQRAKAAIGVGVTTLLSRSELDMQELNRVYISGAFGHQLNIDNAQSIGLLPDISPEKFQLCGNTALAGCEQWLLRPEKRTELVYLRQNATIINLSNLPDFETLFLENLYLQPQKGDTI